MKVLLNVVGFSLEGSAAYSDAELLGSLRGESLIMSMCLLKQSESLAKRTGNARQPNEILHLD